jgi:opacity protein-like surface antigen
MIKLSYLATGVCVLLLSVVSWAQPTSHGGTQYTSSSYPKFEVPIDFSFINVHPDLPLITSFNVFGGGLAGVYNFTPLVGIKADFQFYTQGTGVKNKLEHDGFPAGQLSANFVTYMFGPQIKKHTGKFQPFGEALFGAAHSNEFAQILEDEGIINKSSTNNAFAMEFGGGLDIPLTPNIQLRPVEVDYLLTRFGVNGTTYTGSQNNFKYSVGVNFTFGGK